MKAEDFHGHPDYLTMTEEELELHSRKNKDYTRGGDPLGNFKRVASILGNYPGLNLADPAVVALVFGFKQLDAALWMLCQGYEGDVEDVDARLTDTHVYVKIARILHKEKKMVFTPKGLSCVYNSRPCSIRQRRGPCSVTCPEYTPKRVVTPGHYPHCNCPQCGGPVE